MKEDNDTVVRSRIGLGCGNLVNTFGSEKKEQSIYAIHAAMDAGIRMLNTAEFYGCGDSECVIGEALRNGKRAQAYISDKFGALMEPGGGMYGLDVHPHHVKDHLAYSLKRLNTDYVDLYQPGRIDLAIPVEETVGAIAEMVEAGYVREIGLTQVDAATLRRAEKVHHISYVEWEYSLFNRSIEGELMDTARELGVKIVAFGTLAYGLLSASFSRNPANAMQSSIPILREGNLDQNRKLVDQLRVIAKEKHTDVSVLAVAWMLHKGETITPLVGSGKAEHILHALEAEKLELTEDDEKRIEAAVPKEQIAGATFPQMKFKNGVAVRP